MVEITPSPLASGSEFRWAQRARLLLCGGALALVLINFGLSETSIASWAYWCTSLLVILFIGGALLNWWANSTSRVSVSGSLQFIWDVTIVTGTVALTGGPSSPFLSLYLPVVMIASVLTGRWQAIGISVFSAATYGLVAWGLLRGFLPNPLGDGEVSAPTGGIALQVTGLLSAMVLVAVAVNFLVRGLKASQAETAASIRTLSEISEKQRELVDSLPGGIILTDESSKVTRLNRAAAILLGVSEDFALTKTLPTLLASVADKDSVHLPTSEKGGECTITRPTEKEPLRLSITSQQLSKTLHGTEGVLISLSNVTELRSIEEQLAVQERMARLLSEEQRDPVHHNLPNFQSFVGESQIMQKVFQLIQRVATSEATALIHGESGTGKELVARALHNGGRRSKGAFVPVNCGAIPENLIESELFGHMKGSFTGAESDHPGMFKQASGGTLFLDEIGELPIAMQAKLLRALQERSVRPVGSTRDIPIDVRIVAATNRNLKREVEAGRFREDLYYRLNVITISLPPLRDRKDDLPILMKAILNRLAGAGSLPVVSPQAMQLLLTYQYPGNVRELENILERAFVLGGQVILPEHLPEMMRSLPPSGTTGDLITAQPETQIIIDETIQLPANLDEILGQIERRYLETALLRSQGAKKRAADLLGINFRSFRYRLQKFGLSDS